MEWIERTQTVIQVLIISIVHRYAIITMTQKGNPVATTQWEIGTSGIDLATMVLETTTQSPSAWDSLDSSESYAVDGKWSSWNDFSVCSANQQFRLTILQLAHGKNDRPHFFQNQNMYQSTPLQWRSNL